MRTNPLTGQPLLIIAPDALSEHLKKFFLSENTPFSPGQIECAANYDQALSIINGPTNHYGAILFALEDESPAGLLTLTEVKAAAKGPLIILTDDREVVNSCREKGLIYFLPTESLTPAILGDVIEAANEHDNLIRTTRQLEDVQNAAERRFRDIADHFADWLWEMDKDLNITFSSSRKRPTQSANAGTKFTACFLPDEKNRIEDDFAQLIKDPRPFHDYEYWSFDAYGTRLCWAVSGVPIYNEEQKLSGFRGIARDVSTQKASADQLYYLSNNDSLTGLYNRRRFYDELTRTVRQSGRNGTEGALVLIDIDRFNYVNDTYGHELGDRLLVHVAQLLKDNVRAIDFLARTGSNEFAIIMPDLSLNDINYRVKALSALMKARPLPYDRGTITFSASIGIVRFPEQGNSADELLSRIGMAVLQAKEKGRNRAEMFQEEQLSAYDNTKRLEWLDFVSRCLNEEQERIVLHFQPIVPLNVNDDTQLFEVLVRMIDDEGELVSPFKFIETAEEFGLIGKIDQLVVSRAIELIKRRHAEGRNVQFSVNISSRTFDDEDSIAQIRQTLEESKPPFGSVILELTETALIRDLSHVRGIIKDFKALGVRFALDDCGVGYSSLNYIRKLDLDFIKIDGTFIRNLHRNESDSAFVAALRDVAKQLGIQTVAEMVENAEIAEKLRAIGIDYAQGYYYAIPGPDLPDALH